MSKKLNCFKTYDIRGKIGSEFNPVIAYQITVALVQHLKASIVIVGYDVRESSPVLAKSVMEAVKDCGATVLSIGMAGTEEMYWAVTRFKACAGVEVTASHNPIEYNGMKMVKAGSKPLDYNADFLKLNN